MKQTRKRPAPAAPEERLVFYKDLREARRRRLTRRRRHIFTAVFALVLALLVYVNWDNFVPQEVTESLRDFFTHSSSEHFPVALPSGEFRAAAWVGSNLGVLTDTSYFLYSNAGTELAWRQHGMNDPQLSAAGGRALLYDQGGKQFRVETRFDTSVSASTAYPILSGSMGTSGKFALVTSSSSYLGELIVYDAQGKEIFHWYDATNRILAAALSPDGKSVAAVETGAKNGVIQSTVNVFRLGSTKPVGKKEFDGLLLISLQYSSASRITAVGKTQTVYLDQDGKQTGQYDYGNRQLSCYANTGGATVLVFDSYESGSAASSLVPLLFGGSVLHAAPVTIDDKVTSVYTGQSGIVALSSGLIWHGDKNGKAVSVTHTQGDKPAALEDKKAVYVFGLQAINRYAGPK